MTRIKSRRSQAHLHKSLPFLVFGTVVGRGRMGARRILGLLTHILDISLELAFEAGRAARRSNHRVTQA